MHNIICPDCGELFMGYQVAFDISEYVRSLLYYSKDEQVKDKVNQLKFNYFVDEEMIRKSNPSVQNGLNCDSAGPGHQAAFPFKVTMKMLYEYVLSKCESADEKTSLTEFLSAHAKNVLDKQEFPSLNDVTKTLYRKLFCKYNSLDYSSDPKSENAEEAFDSNSQMDENEKTALSILCYLYRNRENEVSKIINLAIHKDDFSIPETLFVQDGGRIRPYPKRCKYCGQQLPDEFGRYKMKPVVLLGPASSGKTAYLLALYNAVLRNANLPRNIRELAHNGALPIHSLTNDCNLDKMKELVEKYENNTALDKTALSSDSVPILNLLIGDTIYSFIDWPGEAFADLNDKGRDFVCNTRPVIKMARHALFFLSCAQIDEELPLDNPTKNKDETDNSAPINETTERLKPEKLGGSLKRYFGYFNKYKIRSISYVVNKVDKLAGRDCTEEMFRFINTPIPLSQNNQWNQNVLDEVSAVTEAYIENKNYQVYNILPGQEALGRIDLYKYFFPVAPYGQNVSNIGEPDAVNVAKNVGVPLLSILRIDGII